MSSGNNLQKENRIFNYENYIILKNNVNEIKDKYNTLNNTSLIEEYNRNIFMYYEMSSKLLSFHNGLKNELVDLSRRITILLLILIERDK